MLNPRLSTISSLLFITVLPMLVACREEKFLIPRRVESRKHPVV